MKKWSRMLALLLIGIPSVLQPMHSFANTSGAPAKFSNLEDQFVKESLALSPVSASQAGYHKHVDAKTGRTILLDRELDDLSSAAVATQVKFYRDWRQKFSKETPVASLSSQDAADYCLMLSLFLPEARVFAP